MAHKGARNDLTAEEVRTLFDYDPRTGTLTRKRSATRTDKVGKPAGYRRPNDNIAVKIHGRAYLAHRLIWLIVTGHWPKIEIDHIDLDRTNNKWNNLREATSSQNMANNDLRSDNKSGFKGVRFSEKYNNYRAVISFKRKTIHIGCYATAKEAYAAYCDKAKELHGDFARLK